MALRYICKKCGYVLYDSEKKPLPKWHGLPTPSEIISLYGGVCPRCKRELSLPDLEDIEVKVV